MEGKIRGSNELKWQGALVEDYSFGKENDQFPARKPHAAIIAMADSEHRNRFRTCLTVCECILAWKLIFNPCPAIRLQHIFAYIRCFGS